MRFIKTLSATIPNCAGKARYLSVSSCWRKAGAERRWRGRRARTKLPASNNHPPGHKQHCTYRKQHQTLTNVILEVTKYQWTDPSARWSATSTTPIETSASSRNEAQAHIVLSAGVIFRADSRCNDSPPRWQPCCWERSRASLGGPPPPGTRPRRCRRTPAKILQ